MHGEFYPIRYQTITLSNVMDLSQCHAYIADEGGDKCVRSKQKSEMESKYWSNCVLQYGKDLAAPPPSTSREIKTSWIGFFNVQNRGKNVCVKGKEENHAFLKTQFNLLISSITIPGILQKRFRQKRYFHVIFITVPLSL